MDTVTISMKDYRELFTKALMFELISADYKAAGNVYGAEDIIAAYDRLGDGARRRPKAGPFFFEDEEVGCDGD